MKILLYIHALTSGGAERVLVTLANHFAERGDNVIISCDTELGTVFPVNEKVVLYNHREGCYSTTLLRKMAPLRFIKTLSNMRRIEKEFNPDVAIAFITTFNIYTQVALMFRRVPVVLCEHTHVKVKLPLREYIGRELTYPFANAISVLTRHDYNLWKHRYKGTVRMPNPCESIDDTRIRKTERKRIVLAAGRVTSWEIKGFDNLIRSWCLICNEFPEWELWIAGSTDEMSVSYLNGIINENNGKNVKFLGFRKDVYDLMEKVEVYVLSSRREGLPMTLIEAMSKGCCCVSFDVETGPSDIIHHNKDGVLVENQNVEKMAAALKDVISDDAFRNKLGTAAIQSIERFDVAHVLKRWDILFRKIVKNKR